jgi:hypothetical protein
MIEIVKFQPVHLSMIAVQPEQMGDAVDYLNPDYGNALYLAGPGYTCKDGDRIIACGGKVEQWAGRSIVWTVLSDSACRHMFRVTKCARRAIELWASGKEERLEAIVRSGFLPGARWVELCGFEYEHTSKKFLPNGCDADVYVRFA